MLGILRPTLISQILYLILYNSNWELQCLLNKYNICRHTVQCSWLFENILTVQKACEYFAFAKISQDIPTSNFLYQIPSLYVLTLWMILVDCY